MADDARETRQPGCAIAAIVMCYRGRATVVDAVRSLTTQDVVPDILVVSSGGGDVAGLLAEAGLDVRIVEVAGRLLPGGARNLGIRETDSRIVAFLADDCIATPGWVRARLDAHRAGARAVASFLTCHRPRRAIALAAHLSLFVRRMPGIEPHHALAYGASYDRALFEEYGSFREDLEGGEDTEFNRRLAPADKPALVREVVTIHQGVELAWPFLADQYRRGRRSAENWPVFDRLTPAGVARQAIARLRFILRHSFRVVDRRLRWKAALAVPWIVLGGLTYASGALLVACRPRRTTETRQEGRT